MKPLDREAAVPVGLRSGVDDAPTSADERLAAEQRLSAELDQLELLPYYDADAAVEPAAVIEQQARKLEAVDLQLRARLIQADVMLRSGKTTDGGQIALDINQWAIEHQHTHLLCRSHRLLATVFDRVGDYATSLEHAVKAVELTAETLPPRMRVGHLMGLAAALVRTRSFAEARERYQVAEQIAESLGDVDLTIHLLNDLAWLENDAGESARSLVMAERMQAYAAANGVTLPASALDTVARAEMGLGRFADAERTMQPVLDCDDATLAAEEFDGLGDALLMVVEIRRAQGRFAEAHSALERCDRLAADGALGWIRVRLRRERAELAAAEGNYKEAFEQYKLFHAESEALSSEERDARARTLQAVFETTEARREGQRFREMSLRDPLTGLRNRRYVDEQVPVLLRRAVEAGADLSLALVDLDFFKAINDNLSHDVGDEVLRRVARILTESVPEPGFVARMGGEEFLLVLPDVGQVEAMRQYEKVRLAVRGQMWSSLTGQLPVTVSIGGTGLDLVRTTKLDLLKSELLSHADRNLYAAKRAGRDRVVAGTD